MEEQISIMDQRANLLRLLEQVVLKAIKEGERTGWKLKELTYIDEINKIGQLSRWREKSKLFIEIDYRSGTYLSILHLGRKVLADLKDGSFTLNCSEYVRTFMNLSPQLKRKKFMKLTDKESGELKIVGRKDDVVVMEIEEKKPMKEIMIGPKVTGMKLIQIMDSTRELDDINI